jgi:hypothetical protein
VNVLQIYIMKKGIQIFADNCPSWVFKRVFGAEIDHVKLRNDLSTAVRLAAKP